MIYCADTTDTGDKTQTENSKLYIINSIFSQGKFSVFETGKEIRKSD